MADQLAHERQEPAARLDAPNARKPFARTPGRRRPAPAPAEDIGADASFVSVKTLAKQWDCSRTTVSRLLEQAGVQAYYFGTGRNGAKRYLKTDVENFLSRVERL